jgi:hypothetical protein
MIDKKLSLDEKEKNWLFQYIYIIKTKKLWEN